MNDIVTIAVVLACGMMVLKRFTAWKQRFRAVTSPLIQAPRYRALLLLVVVGILLVSTLPEAAFVLPALDAIGLDLVTILVAFELRHYLASVLRLVRIPDPRLWAYQCMWVVIWIRTVKGTMTIARPPGIERARRSAARTEV